MRYQYTPIKMSKIKGLTISIIDDYVEELELSYTVRVNVKYYNHFGKQSTSYLKVKHTTII